MTKCRKARSRARPAIYVRHRPERPAHWHLSGCGRGGAGQQGQDLPDSAFPPVRFWQREMRLDLVAVTAAVLLLDYVDGLEQIRADAEGAAFGDVQAGCHGTQAHPRVMGDEQPD